MCAAVIRRRREEAAAQSLAMAAGATTGTAAVVSSIRTLQDAKSDAVAGFSTSAGESNEVEFQCTDGTKCCVCSSETS